MFGNMYDSLIVPYDLSIQLGIVRMMCHGMEGAKVKKMTAEEDDLEGEEEEEPKRNHLSPKMKMMAEKFPKVLKDSLKGSNGLKNQPHNEIDINPASPQSTILM